MTMTKPIQISIKSWEKLSKQILKDYPPSVALIREKKKRVLGFTNRDYSGKCPKTKRWIKCVMLDFYDEKKRTFFILKYGDYFNDKE